MKSANPFVPPSELIPLLPNQLAQWFEQAQKVQPNQLIGTEFELFGVAPAPGPDQKKVSLPVHYAQHICPVLEQFREQFAWSESADRGLGGELTGLSRHGSTLSLEPGGQFEFSGRPLPSIHATCADISQYHHELDVISKPLHITWIAAGFHPFARLQEVAKMPKGRYQVMSAYLPSQGKHALDMMYRTCTVQANFDFASEQECGQRLRTALAISALVTAIFANSPFAEKQLTGRRSQRSYIWSHVDASRCGLLDFIFIDQGDFSYEKYIDWALAIPMFFIKRNQQYLPFHRSFAEYLQHGFVDDHGIHHRATQDDWKLHLNTLFPEVRLNPFLEVRGADCVGSRFVCALPALWKGVLYDQQALAAAFELVRDLDIHQRYELWDECRTHGMHSTRVHQLSRQLLKVAREGLDRQAVLDSRGRTEAHFLDEIETLVDSGRSPADEMEASIVAAQHISPTNSDFVQACYFAGAHIA